MREENTCAKNRNAGLHFRLSEMIELSYTSCACNRTPHSVDWGNNNAICFASAHIVAIGNPHVSLKSV